MRKSATGHLILKDWRLHRLHISLTVAAGAVALAMSQFRNGATVLLGIVWFFVALCILGSMLPVSSIANERKKQNLAFVMSLPVSSVQYTMAKIVSTVAMFLAPWLTLLIAALLLIETRSAIPHGTIPTLLILAILPFLGFCLILAAALVSETEGWVVATSVVCNSSYWFVWYLISSIPSLAATWKSAVAVWNPAAVTVLCAELGLIALIAAVTFYLQSRKRDFV
ncbi:MAG: ABC-2 transporter permease [Bryobacteraceae bacterium]